ncbi:BnaA05g19200D [Brassica napus]|uniref:(rape) hypothetical protein n=1 Tax=Brassica napus TaxID=3708 RepID=A0A078GJC5_BRANA|nr:unnamed protein product [Brassica napus]CDY25364.1 BnaA05g19200D [Brassica napus]
MESKRMTIMFITMMIVIGNFVVQTEAQAQTNPFRSCFPGCIVSCAIEKKFPTGLMCPFTCLMTCLLPPTSNITTPPSQMILANKKIDHNDYFCKLGCASHHCLVLSSLQNPSKSLFIYSKKAILFHYYKNILFLDYLKISY